MKKGIVAIITIVVILVSSSIFAKDFQVTFSTYVLSGSSYIDSTDDILYINVDNYPDLKIYIEDDNNIDQLINNFSVVIDFLNSSMNFNCSDDGIIVSCDANNFSGNVFDLYDSVLANDTKIKISYDSENEIYEIEEKIEENDQGEDIGFCFISNLLISKP